MSRRARVAERVGKTNALVLFSAEPKVYTGDVDYEYRQENNFYYLTNLRQERAVLVVMPGVTETREILFLPRRDPRTETWTGRMYSPEEAAALSGIEEIWARPEFDSFMRALADGKPYRPQSGGILRTSSGGERAAENAARGDAIAAANPLLEARGRGAASLLMLAPVKEQREGAREWTQESRFADVWERDVKNFPSLRRGRSSARCVCVSRLWNSV
jgi:Xaa-Pro aminopeptidase